MFIFLSRFFFIFLFIWILVFIFSFICSCCQTCSFFHLVFGFVFPVHCVLVSRYAVLCLFPVCVYSCIQMVSFSKVPHFLSIHFGWGAKQALPINQIHAMKPYENPNENPSENPNENPNENPFWQWTKTLILFKKCKWKWQNENIVFF